MNLKNKLKSYSFWVSLTAGIILVINCFLEQFGMKIDDVFVNSLVNSICGVLVILGLLTNTNSKTVLTKDDEGLDLTENDKTDEEK